jgi:hypothetical protein
MPSKVSLPCSEPFLKVIAFLIRKYEKAGILRVSKLWFYQIKNYLVDGLGIVFEINILVFLSDCQSSPW